MLEDEAFQQEFRKEKDRIMKKKLFVLMMAGCLAVTGCGNKDEASKGDTTPTPTEEAASPTTQAGGLINNSGNSTVSEGAYWAPQGTIVLGDYKGIEVPKVTFEVTDEEIQAEIDYFLYYQSELQEVTDRTDVQEGDIINIDYSLTVDGEEIDSNTGYDLELGTDDMEIEAEMIGAEVGDQKVITRNIEDDYNYADYVGQEGIYTVVINSIQQEYTPELTDELVAANTDYSTVEEYRQGLYDELYASEEEAAANEQISNCFRVIIDQSEFTGLAEADAQSYVDEMISYYENYASMYGLDTETFISVFTGSTYDEFLASAKEQGDYVVKQNLILKKIIEKENLELTDEEYADGLADYATEYGYETTEEFEEYAGKDEVSEALLLDKAYNLVVDSMIVAE